MIDRKLLNKIVAHRIAISPKKYDGDGFDLFVQGIANYIEQKKPLSDEDTFELGVIMAQTCKNLKEKS